jgi:CHAD domain-containing protein
MAQPLHDLAPDLLKRLEHKVAHRSQHIARRSDGDLHALRKAMKKLRYSIEFLAPLLRHKQAKTYLHRCKQSLKHLGSLNDAVMAVTLAERLGGERKPELAPAVAALAGWSKAQQADARHHLKKDWRALQAVQLPR